MRYICPLCGEVYDEEDAGESFADLPENWTCPLCMAPKSSFRPETEPADNGARPSDR